MDYVADLHIDNGARGGPQGWFGKFDFTDLKNPTAKTLIVAGDTGEYLDDTVDFLNAATAHYDFVVGCLGNHEKGPQKKFLGPRAFILDHQPGFRVDNGDIAFVGACLDDGDTVQADGVEAAIRGAWADHVRQLIVVTHFVPLDTLEPITGHPQTAKCNGFLARLPDDPPVPTTVVFGHLHLEVDINYRGYRLVHNPRGYRGLRRDKTAFRGFKQL